MIRHLFVILTVFISIAACSVNPVTGKRELNFVSEADEIRLGEQNYAPMQQQSGGVYDIDPVLTEYVSGIGQKLAAVSDRDLPYEFVVLNSSVPNAWALPGGKIAINRGLLTEMNDEAELAAVIGHEIVHAAAKHSALAQTRGSLLQVAVIGTAIAAGGSGYGDLAAGGAGIGAQLISQSYGREAELESDFYGMQYMSRAGYNPQGAVRLQQTFVRLSEGRATDWISGLFSSHPPSQERVNANIRTAESLPPGGVTGKEAYDAAMSKTIEAKPAYDAYDEGYKALADGNAELAEDKAEEAIGLFPEEADFYALRGDVRYVNEDYERAIENYDIAIRRRDSYFRYYLQRGLAKEKLKDDGAAKTDLDKSNEMIPTAPAHYALGNIAVRQGRKADAIEHYSLVAGGQGEVADAARMALARLDLEDNPDKYIQAQCFQESNGNLGVSVTNRTSIRVTGVRFIVQYSNASGQQRQEQSVSGSLDPGQAVRVSTGLGPYNASVGCPVQISAAQIEDLT